MNLLTSLPDLILSSQLQSLVVYTEYNQISITLFDNDQGEQFFNCTLRPYSKRAVLYDLRDIIEEWMDFNKSCVFEMLVRIEENGTENDFLTNVVYCSVEIEGDTTAFLNSRFLTAQIAKLTYPGVHEVLTYVVVKGDSMTKTWNIVYEKDGQICTERFVISEEPSRWITSWDIDSSLAEAQKLLDTKVAEARILSYKISIGQRSFTYYVEDASPPLNFYFRNSFGAFEYIAFWGVTTQKTEAVHTEAVCSHKAIFFDRGVNKTYEVETGPLPSSLLPSLEMMVASNDVRIQQDNNTYNYPRILITDHTCEFSDTDEEMNTLKFTYRYADTHPHIQMDLNQPTAGRIFSDQFDREFS